MKLRGCGTALVTPFKQDGSLDESALRELVRWQVESGIDFLVPCGTTGETPTLTHDEWLRVIDLTIETAGGRVPIMAGATSNNTREAVEKTKEISHASGSRLHPDRDAVLQQAHARRRLSALQGDCRGLHQASDAVQHRGANRHEHRNADAAAPGGNPQHRRRQRSQRQHRADRRGLRLGARGFSGLLRRRRHYAGRDWTGRRGYRLGRLQRNSGGDVAHDRRSAGQQVGHGAPALPQDICR